MRVHSTFTFSPEHKKALALKALNEGTNMSSVIEKWIEKYAAKELKQVKGEK